ncbi:flagellar assembly peptidoglycan hydrolase FlgJ [Pseudomonas aeruginosa]|nr:flagellar assembly peptidoglycan hydrolase FlgJ [Pseudomonas aeruginosa]
MDSRLLSGIGAGPDSGSYTDLNRLNQLKVGKDRDGEANILKVAQEFESLFLNEMLKSMRSANEALGDGNFMNSQTTKQYQDMYDQQLSVSLSKNAGGIGLADVLVRQLSKMKQGSRGNGENPFARVAENGAGRWPSNPSAQAGKALPMPEAGRDDSKLLNQRRLALPGKLAERMLAGIVPSRLAGRQPDAEPGPGQLPAGAELPGGEPPRFLHRWRRQPGQPAHRPAAAGQGKSMFASADEFIATMLPMAQKAAERIGVDARYLVAQAALETGWGKSIIRQQDGGSSHNLFGIKTGSRWDGASARALTTEYEGGKAVKEVAAFRSYSSFEQSFHDYVSFLQGNDRYQNALDSAANPERFVQELQRAGYATDPQYARKVAQIARQMQTYQAVAAAGTPPLG